MGLLDSNIIQQQVKSQELFISTTTESFNSKNFDTLIIDISVDGLNDLATLNSFLYATIRVVGVLNGKQTGILPENGFVNGTKISGIDSYQFVLNGNYRLVYDVAKWESIKLEKSASSSTSILTAKAALIKNSYNNYLPDTSIVSFSNKRNVINHNLRNSKYIDLDVIVSDINESVGEYIQLFITGSSATDNIINGNNIVAISYPDGTSMSSTSGGVTFRRNGRFNLTFAVDGFEYLRIINDIKGNGTFNAKIRFNDLKIHELTEQLKKLNNISSNDMLLADAMESGTLSSAIIKTRGSKFIIVDIYAPTNGGYFSALGYSPSKREYTDILDVYAESTNSVYNDYRITYNGEVKDKLIIYCEGYEKLWLRNTLNLEKDNVKITYRDQYTLSNSLDINFVLNPNNTWTYNQPRFRTLCALFGLTIEQVQYMKIDYKYVKGYTSGFNISPTFNERWSTDTNVENRPRFYNIYGEELFFHDTYNPQDYKYNYAKLIYDSEDIYFIKTQGRNLSDIGIGLLGYVTNNPSNQFTCTVKLSVTAKEQFYIPAQISEHRTFRVEINDHKNYRYANSSRAKNAHIYGGTGVIYISSDSARYYKLPINSTNFPNLPTGNNYPQVFVIPCSWNESNSWNNMVRMCVVINGKVYHNYPSSYVDNLAAPNKEMGILKFEESNVWDLPVRQSGNKKRTDISARKLPSTLTETQIEALPDNRKYIYKYFPVLPSSLYNSDGTYKYSNESNDKPYKELWYDYEGIIIYPRYYNFRGANDASFMYTMMSPATSSKMTLIGHYFTSTADRAVNIATSDGGANWYVKFDYASLNSQRAIYNVTPLWGNDIWTANLKENYVSGSLTVKKRSYITPNKLNKEPNDMFSFSESKPIPAISKANGTAGNETAIITCEGHGLNSRDVILFNTANGYTGSFRCLANDTATENSGGNGTFFVVEKIDDNRFKIREYIHSPDHNITGRHIHHINTQKDGFVISAGEEYPDGWIVYLQQKEKDQPQGVNAAVHMPYYRLNSSEEGIYRASGFIMLDDSALNPTCLFASDESNIPRGTVNIEGRTNMFGRNSAGVYRGRLADIDDMTKWECVLPADEMILALFQHGRHIIAVGMSGGFYVSDDNGNNWDKYQYPNMQNFNWITNSGELYNNISKVELK